MRQLDRLLPDYQAALADFLSTEDDLAREVALNLVTELGKAAVADELPTIDELRELHRHAQQQLVKTWRALPQPSGGRAALERLARGDAEQVGIAFMLPHELAQMRLHEQRWHREHGKLLALFDQTDDMILVLDQRGQIESVNPAFTRMTGWSLLDATTRMAAIWRGPLPASTTQQQRHTQRRRDGSSFTAEWSISPILDQERQLLSHVCIGRDISRQEQIDHGLRENDKLRAVATLAGGIAHDFNNLLGSINGLAELCALEAPEGSRQARNLARILEAGDKAATLVRQMLDFSRQTPPMLQRLTVAEWLGHAEGLLRAALPPPHTLAVQVVADGLLQIDLVQMEQVLLNIVRNAAQAMGDTAGTVCIVADRAEPNPPSTCADAGTAGHVRLQVIDTGAGMAPELLDKIFEPFFTTKPVGEGTGLGLAAVHGIVSGHGGVIAVHSTLGVGTTFSLYLPLADAASGAA